MVRQGYRTGIAGLVVAQGVALGTAVGYRRGVPSCWSNRPALHVSYSVVDLAAADLAVVATSFHSYAVEARLELVGRPSVAEGEAVEASSAADA